LCQRTRTAKTLKTRGKTDLFTYVQNTSFVNMFIEKRITVRFSSRDMLYIDTKSPTKMTQSSLL
jgi:hypothetical protein